MKDDDVPVEETGDDEQPVMEDPAPVEEADPVEEPDPIEDPDPIAHGTWAQCEADGGSVRYDRFSKRIPDCSSVEFDLGVSVSCVPGEGGCDNPMAGRCCWSLRSTCDFTPCTKPDPYEPGYACLEQGGQIRLATKGSAIPRCNDGEQDLGTLLWCDSWETGLTGCDTGVDTPARCCLPL